MTVKKAGRGLLICLGMIAAGMLLALTGLDFIAPFLMGIGIMAGCVYLILFSVYGIAELVNRRKSGDYREARVRTFCIGMGFSLILFLLSFFSIHAFPKNIAAFFGILCAVSLGFSWGFLIKMIGAIIERNRSRGMTAGEKRQLDLAQKKESKDFQKGAELLKPLGAEWDGEAVRFPDGERFRFSGGGKAGRYALESGTQSSRKNAVWSTVARGSEAGELLAETAWRQAVKQEAMVPAQDAFCVEALPDAGVSVAEADGEYRVCLSADGEQQTLYRTKDRAVAERMAASAAKKLAPFEKVFEVLLNLEVTTRSQKAGLFLAFCAEEDWRTS